MVTVLYAALGAMAATNALAASIQTAQSVEELRRLSIEDLANVEITSVFKRPEPVSRAPAAVYVITAEDIRRSGAISLPEALRLAPNLHVARVNALSYAISARGFNSFESANKLLVLIDGRSIYTPLHGGVYWDQQQVMLEDVERIEVISGPGGTLWGANAVNGVINVITKTAQSSQGGLASVHLGNVDRGGGARYGGRLGESGAFRIYGRAFDRGSSARAGGGMGDEWVERQGGFRSDFSAGANAFTVQGDLFDHRVEGGSNSGKNVLGRWKRQLDGGSAIEVQGYYDTVDRDSTAAADRLETFDIQAQHAFRAGESHEFVWGGGHRLTKDEFLVSPPAVFFLAETSDTVQISNLFVQDSIALRNDLTLTAGTKFEYSSYSGLEFLPSVRLAWSVSDDILLWSAVSRAVRTPTRIDRDLVGPGILERATGFDSEELIAYEVGYRGRPTAQSSISVSLFYNSYDDLRVLATSPSTGLLIFDNKMEGHTYGAEIWGDYQALRWWRLSAGVTLLQKRLRLAPGAVETAIEQHRGNDPDYHFSIRSQMNLSDSVELDLALRRVDDLPAPIVPGYLEADAHLGWRATERLYLSLSGFNLFDNHHPETGAAATRAEVRRMVYAGARVRF